MTSATVSLLRSPGGCAAVRRIHVEDTGTGDFPRTVWVDGDEVVGGERPGEGLDVHDFPYTTSLTTPVPRNANFPLTSPSANPYCSRTTSQ